jgi:hypothetical protein
MGGNGLFSLFNLANGVLWVGLMVVFLKDKRVGNALQPKFIPSPLGEGEVRAPDRTRSIKRCLPVQHLLNHIQHAFIVIVRRFKRAPL